MVETGTSARTDMVSGAVWFVLGTAIVQQSWTMDRLESLNINPYTVPGLVPGLLGALIVVFSLVLIFRAMRSSAAPAAPLSGDALAEDRAGWRRFGIAVAFCCVYGLGLIGHGLPFWLVTAAFVAAFVFTFDFPRRRAAGQTLRGAALAVVYGLATGLLVSYLFEDVFLVRLP